MNPLSVSPEPPKVAAWVGLDWADQQHVICLYDVSTGQREIARLEQKPEAFEDWLSQLRQRFSEAKVAIVLEQARGAVIYALLSVDFLLLYPVNLNRWPATARPMSPVGPRVIPPMRFC